MRCTTSPFVMMLAAGILTVSVQGAHAQSDDIQIGPEPDWADKSALAAMPDSPTGLAYLRRNDVLVHLDNDGQSTFFSQRMKILDSRALEIGNVGLSWNPAAGAPTVHSLTVHRGGEVTNVLSDNAFEVIRREDQLELSMLNGYLTAILRVPDLRVGDELEWAYTVPSHDPTMRSDSFGILGATPAPLPGHHKIGISWESGQEPSLQFSDDFEGLVERGDRKISVSLDNPDMVTPPKDAPPRYSWKRIIEFSDFAAWPDVSKQFNELFVASAKLPEDSEVKSEAARIAKAHSGELERARAALELVQQQVRYIYVGLNGGNIEPVDADEVWRLRYGDCKGKTVLLMALLNELGIKAEAVLVNNTGIDDGFDERLPSPALFDHVLVRAEINGNKYWMDPTMPDVVGPSRTPFLSYRWVLPLSSYGGLLEPASQKPFALPQELDLYEIDARAGFEKPSRIVRTNIKRGVEGLAEYMQYSALTAQQIESGYQDALAGSDVWHTVESVSYRYDRDTMASILTIEGTADTDWDDEGDGAYDLSLPGGGFVPPSKRMRAVRGNEDKDIPFYKESDFTCSVTTVRLPDDTKLKNWGFNSVFDTTMFGRAYYRMMERRDDRTIRMIRSSRIENPEITAKHALQDNDRIASFDNSQAVITYSPNKAKSPKGHLRPVPATYEIDWAGDDVPCLSYSARWRG